MILSTLCRMAASCVLLVAAPLTASQPVALTLSPLETHANNPIRLKLSLNATSNSAPAALQWTFRLPPGHDIVSIEAGKAVKEAGKTLVCNGAKCIVYGLNRTTIPNGTIAVLKMKVDQSLARKAHSAQFKYESHGRTRMKKPEIQIADLVAASPDGKAITVVSGLSY